MDKCPLEISIHKISIQLFDLFEMKKMIFMRLHAVCSPVVEDQYITFAHTFTRWVHCVGVFSFEFPLSL